MNNSTFILRGERIMAVLKRGALMKEWGFEKEGETPIIIESSGRVDGTCKEIF